MASQPIQTAATEQFCQTFAQLPLKTQRLVCKKVKLLILNPGHPSLQTHRLRQAKEAGIWVCYLSINMRLVYQRDHLLLRLWQLGSHAVVDTVHLRSFPPQTHFHAVQLVPELGT